MEGLSTTLAGEQFEVVDPATGDVVGTVPEATREDVRAAIDDAERGAAHWRQVVAGDRARLLRRAAAIMLERGGEIAAVMTAEQGKPLAEAVGEVRYAAGFFDWFAGEAERVYGAIAPSADPSKRVFVLRQPVGVTAAITPWNFPAAMLTRKLGPAIAAGCSCVVKPAEQTPLTAVEICRALDDAGAPAGLISLVTSNRPEMVADELLGDPRVRKLSFTGSTPVGQELIRGSAQHVTRLSLELGGHAPYNARVIRMAEQLQVGVIGVNDGAPSTPSAPFGGIKASGYGREGGAAGIEEYLDVEDALAGGARLAAGGGRLDREGHFFAPTVLDDITGDMLIAREETFGPVTGLTAFEDEPDVVAMANDTPYGLAAYVHTLD